jgi:hypothetical protein
MEFPMNLKGSTSQKAVVLVVDKYSQDVHLASLTAGVKYPVKFSNQAGIAYTRGFYSILADLANVQPGVRVFFYRRRVDEPPEARGFIGEWEADGTPYEDLQTAIAYGTLKIFGCCPICRCPISKLTDNKPCCDNCGSGLAGHILPLRFPIKQVHAYSRYLDDNTAYVDITDEGRLSTLIFRKVYGAGRERSVNPILPEEAEKLRRLLQRVGIASMNNQVHFPKVSPHKPPATTRLLDYHINFSQKFPLDGKGQTLLYDVKTQELVYETVLEFWLMRELANNHSQLLSTLGISPNEQLEWFANQVLFGIGGEKSDVLLLMRNQANQRCRAVVIELKKGAVDSHSLEQVKSYAYWIAQLATAQVQNAIQRPFEITPIAVGRRVKRGTQPFVKFQFQIPYTPSLTVVVDSPRVFTYSVDSANNTLQLSRVI